MTVAEVTLPESLRCAIPFVGGRGGVSWRSMRRLVLISVNIAGGVYAMLLTLPLVLS
jgi:hypothetical protein